MGTRVHSLHQEGSTYTFSASARTGETCRQIMGLILDSSGLIGCVWEPTLHLYIVTLDCLLCRPGSAAVSGCSPCCAQALSWCTPFNATLLYQHCKTMSANKLLHTDTCFKHKTTKEGRGRERVRERERKKRDLKKAACPNALLSASLTECYLGKLPLPNSSSDSFTPVRRVGDSTVAQNGAPSRSPARQFQDTGFQSQILCLSS